MHKFAWSRIRPTEAGEITFSLCGKWEQTTLTEVQQKGLEENVTQLLKHFVLCGMVYNLLNFHSSATWQLKWEKKKKKRDKHLTNMWEYFSRSPQLFIIRIFYFFFRFAAVARKFLSLKYPLTAVSNRKSIYWNWISRLPGMHSCTTEMYVIWSSPACYSFF